MKTVVAMIAVLTLATLAQAEIWVEVDPGVNVGDGLTSYTVHLVADTDANKATAWDGSFIGPMNQIWFGGVMPTPTMTNASFLGDDIVKDSHFLLFDDDLLTARAPNETETAPDGVLDGAFGIAPSAALQDLPLAQIVLAQGEEVLMIGSAADGMGRRFDFEVLIPEPATLSLLGFGLAGILLRRRRK